MKNNYTDIIGDYIENLKGALDNNLELIYIIGSSATKDVVVGWSDIDCIIVISNYNFNDIETIKKISNSYDIKIGNTIYSKKEFEKGLLDQKTIYYLLLYKEKVLNIAYINSNLKIPNIDYNNCKNTTRTVLFNDLHNCKRLLTYMKLDSGQVKSLFKKIYVIMKSILILHNYRPKNYKETFNMFSTNFNYEYFDYLKFIEDFKMNQVDEKKLKNYAFKLIVYVTDKML